MAVEGVGPECTWRRGRHFSVTEEASGDSRGDPGTAPQHLQCLPLARVVVTFLSVCHHLTFFKLWFTALVRYT